MTITPESPLIAQPSGTLERALAYSDTSPADYLQEVFRLAPLVGLDPAIIVAQSAHETDDWRSHWWAQRLNPAGIGITGDPAQNAASQTWANGTDAARGHVAHMFIYTHDIADDPFGLPQDTGNPKPLNLYDQRWHAVIEAGYAGIARTIRDLTGRWAVDPAYHAKIVQKHRAIFGEGVPMPDTKPTILVIAGHRSTDRTGNPVETDMTDDLARAYRDAFRAAGYDCTWLQESDTDADPDDTVGSLDTVSRKAAAWISQQPGECVLFDLHFEGTASSVRGCFAIIPNKTGLTTGAPMPQSASDTWESNVKDRQLGRALVDRLSAITGIPLRQGIREPGLMDERETGVGGQGYRLATFAYTSPHVERCVRLVIEHGAHTNAQDLAIIRQPDFPQKCAASALAAVLAVYGGEVVDPTPEQPKPPTVWWGLQDVGPQKRAHDGAIAIAFRGEVKAKRETRLRASASGKGKTLHILKPGETAVIRGTWRATRSDGSAGQKWAFVEVAGVEGVLRAPLSAFEPATWPTR